jgi:aminocarboxymuconate-semialdehyde decarboxylase
MQSPDLAVKELRRCVEDLGLAGVQIGSHVNEWNLDAPELFPIFEEAERLNACIFVHPWGTLIGFSRHGGIRMD